MTGCDPVAVMYGGLDKLGSGGDHITRLMLEMDMAALGEGLRDTHTLPRQSWEQGYYDILRPGAQSLLDHEDSDVRVLARENLGKIEIFQLYDDSYGYVFYLLQRN